MKKPSSKILTTLAVLFILFMVLPFLQKHFRFVELKPLNGAIEQVEKQELSVSGWFAGDFQHAREQYLNQNFGFRELFIRLSNELGFRMFNKAKANGVIIGKNGYLYEQVYIDAYYGRDFIGYAETDERFRKLKFIQDKLQEQNKTLLVVFCPGKASFYPEYIPDAFKGDIKTTNFNTHLEYAQKYQLNYINFQKYFMHLKGDSAWQLYPQTGIHWSIYGAWLAADSLSKKIEKIRGVDLPDMKCTGMKYGPPQHGDADVAEALNLLYEPAGMENIMKYPEVTLDKQNKARVNLLTIGDSFYWAMLNFTTGIFDNDHFWFYNRTVIPGNADAKNLDLDIEIKNHDVIMLMVTESNLKKFGWGFIENAYSLLAGEDNSVNRAAELEQTIKYIKSDKGWMENIKKKAASRNISIDSMVYLDAVWSIEH